MPQSGYVPGAVVAAGAAYFLFIRLWHLRWGAAWCSGFAYTPGPRCAA